MRGVEALGLARVGAVLGALIGAVDVGEATKDVRVLDAEVGQDRVAAIVTGVVGRAVEEDRAAALVVAEESRSAVKVLGPGGQDDSGKQEESEYALHLGVGGGWLVLRGAVSCLCPTCVGER